MSFSKIFVSAFALASAQSAFGYSDAALADQVTNLPGAENLDISFNQFSGYLTVNGTKNIHYWMVESMNDPKNDPIAFWTNGGPGCSGLLGFLSEQGPFRPNEDLSLSFNEYTWNSIANMVFIESPCGVGFSYSEDADDYKTGDAQTAMDNYEMLQAFFTRFPEYKENDLYITSESYGGHYMPTLAKEIVDQNTAGINPTLNFKGFFLGNPATTLYSTFEAGVETYWGHQLVSKPLWDKFTETCVEPKKPDLEKCEYYYIALMEQTGDLNPYALDYPVCVEDSNTPVVKGSKGPVTRMNRGAGGKFGRSQRTWLMNNQLRALMLAHGHPIDGGVVSSFEAKMRKALKLEPVDGYEPCEEDYMTNYLNQESVKQALHVKGDIDWADCSRTIRYDEKDGFKDMTPYYNYLIDGNYGLNIVVYSGDDDDVCATIGTQSWIWDLGYTPSKDYNWYQYKVNEQPAGFMTKYKDAGFAFITVHGAGHEVPTYKPDVALYLWQNYLKGELTNA